MENNFNYRLACIDDIQQLIGLGLLSYGQYAAEMKEEHLAQLRANIGNPDTWMDLLGKARGFVCAEENKIIGMAFIIPSGNPWDIFETDWSYIRMVGVDPQYQGRGIAKTLTQICIEQARTDREKTIALHTSEMMPAARHIYEKLGFKVLKEIKPRLGKRYWLYTLNLDTP